MADLLMELKGVNGQVEVYDDKIVIKRKGALSKLTQGFFKGDKTIYLNQITGIQVKPAGMMTNGYIQFSLAGGIENTKGILDATKDENSVMFRRTENELVVEMKETIEGLRQKSMPGAVSQVSAADELRKFKQLLDDGIITPEDFEKKKKELIG